MPHSLLFVLLATLPYCHGQATAVNQMVSFSNRLIPHLLQALSYDQNNVAYSPFGLATGLSMLMDGVSSKMSADMTTALGLDRNVNIRPLLRQGTLSLLNHFKKHETDEESFGSYNRAFVQSSEPLLPDYKLILEKYYLATVTNNITSDPGAGLILDIHTDTGVMSHWKDFDKLAVYTYLSHQSSAPFLTSKGGTIEVPMIPQIGEFKAGYIPSLSSQAVVLPLGSKIASLLLIMPDYRDGISDVLVKLLNQNIASIPNSLPTTEAEVSFPQFAIVSSNLNLGKILKKSGLDFIFYDKNNKTRKGPLRSMKQEVYFASSFVALNSVGSTNTVLYKPVAPKRERREATSKFVFNKPFIFMVMHKQSGLVLLAGVVKAPVQVPQ